MIFYLRSIFAQILLNAFIVFRIWKNKDIPWILKYILSFIYGAETIVYFIGLFGAQNLSVETFTLIQKINGVWVIFNIYLASLILLFDLIFYLHKKWGLFSRFREKRIRLVKLISFCVLFAFINLQLFFGYENFLYPEILKFDFSFNKPKNQDQKPVKTYKMLVVSDIHLGYIVDEKILEKYVSLINKEQPDIIVIDGDLVDYDLRPLIAGKMDQQLRKLKAPKGVYFVPGNHEYKFNPEVKLDWIAGCGITVLKDSVANIDNQLFLIGRDDRSNEDKRKPIEELMKHVDLTRPCIFLAHQPADIRDAYKYDIPLAICGHTHRGQVWPMSLFVHVFYTNGYGMQLKGKSTSYTTSGLGLSGFPLRIGSHSEIAIFNIKIY